RRANTGSRAAPVSWTSVSLASVGASISLRQAAMLQHRTDIRILAIKGAKHRSIVHGMALGQDQVAEALAVFAGHAAMALEPGRGIVGQHHRPLIGVIAGE